MANTRYLDQKPKGRGLFLLRIPVRDTAAITSQPPPSPAPVERVTMITRPPKIPLPNSPPLAPTLDMNTNLPLMLLVLVLLAMVNPTTANMSHPPSPDLTPIPAPTSRSPALRFLLVPHLGITLAMFTTPL